MIEENACRPDPNRRRNAELVLSAAMLLGHVQYEDHDACLEIETMVRRLDELGFALIKSDVLAAYGQVAAWPLETRLPSGLDQQRALAPLDLMPVLAEKRPPRL